MRNRVSLAALCVALALACPARATVTSTASSASYTCNGTTTAFTIPFPYLAPSHIIATQKDASGAVTTVTGTVKPSVAPSSGTLTLTTACPSGSTLTITRSVPLDQQQSLRTGSYKGAAIESALDKLTMETQQNAATHAADKTAQTAKDAAQDLSISGVNGAVAALNTGSHAVTDASSVLAFGSTTPRTLTSRFADVANVRDFGAKGDGVTDDKAAIQAAHDSLPSTGGGVYFPPGSYLISGSITSTKPNVRWYGNAPGAWGTDLASTELVTASAITILDLGSATVTTNGGHIIENLTFRDASGAGAALGAIRTRRMNNGQFLGIAARDFTGGYGIQLDGTGNASVITLMQGMKFRNNKVCVQTAGQITTLTLVGGFCSLPAGTGMAGSIGVDFAGVGNDSLRIIGTAFENYENGVKVQGDHAVIQARFEQDVGATPHSAFVWLVSGSGARIENSLFSRGTTGIQVDTTGTAIIGPNHWVTNPTTPIVVSASNFSTTINEPEQQSLQISRPLSSTTPFDFVVRNTNSNPDRHARFVASALNNSVQGVLEAEQTAGAVNFVQVGSITNAGVNLIRNGVTIAQLFAADFSVTTGVDPNGGGMKHLRVAGCATAAAAGATCSTTVTWTTAFANASYTAVCGGDGITSGVPVNGGITARSATSVTFQTVAMTAAAAAYTNISCFATHD